MNLTDKQLAFIDEYLKCKDATQAAISAGYSQKSARSTGARNLTKPDIRAEIEARGKEPIATASELNDKQLAFVNEYLKSWNATQAALKAGYSEKSARVIGAENLTKPAIQAEIQARVAENTMSANEALTSLSEIARGTIADFVEVSADGFVSPNFGKDPDKLKLVKSIKWSKGGLAFEMYSKESALNTIAKHHGLLKERIEIDVSMVIELVSVLQDAGISVEEFFRRSIERAKAAKEAQNR